jgi:hypothetical protein
MPVRFEEVSSGIWEEHFERIHLRIFAKHGASEPAGSPASRFHFASAKLATTAELG